MRRLAQVPACAAARQLGDGSGQGRSHAVYGCQGKRVCASASYSLGHSLRPWQDLGTPRQECRGSSGTYCTQPCCPRFGSSHAVHGGQGKRCGRPPMGIPYSSGADLSSRKIKQWGKYLFSFIAPTIALCFRPPRPALSSNFHSTIIPSTSSQQKGRLCFLSHTVWPRQCFRFPTMQ